MSAKAVLVTQAEPENKRQQAYLAEKGILSLLFPTIALARLPLPEDLQPPADLSSFQHVIFASRHGVRALLGPPGTPLPKAVPASWICIGDETAKELAALGHIADAQPCAQSEAELLHWFDGQQVSGKNILLAKGDLGSPRLGAELLSKGAVVRTVTCYCNTIPKEATAMQLAAILEQCGVITFTSPSAVQHLLSIAADLPVRSLPAICIGSTTAAAAEGAFQRVVYPQRPGLVAMLDCAIAELNQC